MHGGVSWTISLQTQAELTSLIPIESTYLGHSLLLRVSFILHVEVVMAREVGVEDKLLHSVGFGIKENVLGVNLKRM